jgi:hypothetical protein
MRSRSTAVVVGLLGADVGAAAGETAADATRGVLASVTAAAAVTTVRRRFMLSGSVRGLNVGT